jgi:hypothetical protein
MIAEWATGAFPFSDAWASGNFVTADRPSFPHFLKRSSLFKPADVAPGRK